jgi:hypothetical protein
MNLLAVVNPGSRSLFLPGFAVVSLSQFGEGFNYLGVGVLLLIVVALPVARIERSWRRTSLPLVVILIGCALYAVLPQVAIARRVLFEIPSDFAVFDVFRATGRFFWPMGYAVLAASAGLVARQLPVRGAAVVLGTTLILQAIDLHKWWLNVHDGSRGSEFYQWSTPLGSHEWAALLPHYRHLRVYFPAFCRGPVAAPTHAASYLAGIHRLSFNDGSAARLPVSRFSTACRALGEDFSRGFLDDATAYLLPPTLLAEFEGRLGSAVACRTIDGVGVCVSSRSAARRERQP